MKAMWGATARLAVASLLVVPLGADSRHASTYMVGRMAMADSDARLVGAWHKSDGGDCAAGYPAHLRFQSNGLYFGTTEPPGAFTWWDGGTWRVPAPGRLALSTANDAVVTYGYTLDGDILAVTDPAGCRFSYRREA